MCAVAIEASAVEAAQAYVHAEGLVLARHSASHLRCPTRTYLVVETLRAFLSMN